MTKRPPAARHPRAAAGQLLSIAIATLASEPNSTEIVKESPRFLWRVRFHKIGSSLCRLVGHLDSRRSTRCHSSAVSIASMLMR
jgi:hypothetical protein